jgi:hypothetical protein
VASVDGYIVGRGKINVRRTVSLVTLGLLFAGITMAAQQSFVTPPSSLSFSQPWVPPGANGTTSITGTVIDIRQVPVSNVKVQLRNLETGAVVATTETNENGEYIFEIEVPSSYIVEMVLVDGYVIALSNAGSIARYETLQTVIQLPGRWDSVRHNVTATQSTLGFLGMSSETAMTIKTLIMAGTRDISPVDAGEPISPR